MSSFKPDGWRSVTPRIVTPDVAGLVEFLKAVFEARGEVAAAKPTLITIGDSVIMVSDGDSTRATMPAFLYVYVGDADETYRRGIAAGAEAIEPPSDMPYGDRRATLRDPWGNLWQIATYKSS